MEETHKGVASPRHGATLIVAWGVCHKRMSERAFVQETVIAEQDRRLSYLG